MYFDIEEILKYIENKLFLKETFSNKLHIFETFFNTLFYIYLVISILVLHLVHIFPITVTFQMSLFFFKDYSKRIYT